MTLAIATGLASAYQNWAKGNEERKQVQAYNRRLEQQANEKKMLAEQLGQESSNAQNFARNQMLAYRNNAQALDSILRDKSSTVSNNNQNILKLRSEASDILSNRMQAPSSKANIMNSLIQGAGAGYLTNLMQNKTPKLEEKEEDKWKKNLTKAFSLYQGGRTG